MHSDKKNWCFSSSLRPKQIFGKEILLTLNLKLDQIHEVSVSVGSSVKVRWWCELYISYDVILVEKSS